MSQCHYEVVQLLFFYWPRSLKKNSASPLNLCYFRCRCFSSWCRRGPDNASREHYSVRAVGATFLFALMSYACGVVLELIVAHMTRILRPNHNSAWLVRGSSSVKNILPWFSFLASVFNQYLFTTWFRNERWLRKRRIGTWCNSKFHHLYTGIWQLYSFLSLVLSIQRNFRKCTLLLLIWNKLWLPATISLFRTYHDSSEE